MSQTKRIEDMDFKELRKEVQRLSDKLARMERTYADTLENLDDDNFSAQALREKDKMKTTVKHTEKGMELVTKEVYPDGTDAQSAISLQADQIATKVSKSLNFGDAIRGTQSPSRGGDIEKLYFWESDDETEKGYYYYSSISDEWIRVDGTSIYSAFIQTADGFRLHGNVRISGDLIADGTISGVMVETQPSKFGDCVRLNSEDNCLEIIRSGSRAGVWGITDTGSYISGNIMAHGTWNFSNATVILPEGVVQSG